MNEQPNFFSSANRESVPLPQGCPVANHPSGNGFVRAQSGVNLCIGLLAEDAPANSLGRIQLGGSLEMTDWTIVTGSPLLSPDSVYLLSPSLGKLTITPPPIIQEVGTSISPVALKIEVEPIPTGGSLSGDIDGGTPTSVYGGVDPVDGGSP